MSRRRAAEKRQILPDAKFGNLVLGKFLNSLMYNGKKSIAEKIVYGALDIIHTKKKVDPVQFFQEALQNVKPEIEVRSRRVGGATYQVPVEVRPDRRTALCIRWIIENARSRDKKISNGLAAEIIDASNNTGGSIRTRENVHRMAEANKAFAHYRW